ncbi:MAG: DUF1499 domain-containing protein [Pseudomonadota bacterium]
MFGGFGGKWPWRADAQGRTLFDVVPRWLRWGLGALLVLIALGGLMIRAAPHDPERWHVDPFLAERTGRPNDALVASRGATAAPPDRVIESASDDVAEAVARLHAMAVVERRVEVVAGDPEVLHVTYVQRSALFGFPDYITVKADAEARAIAIWSRARYGYSDMGVNGARLARWLDGAGID